MEKLLAKKSKQKVVRFFLFKDVLTKTLPLFRFLSTQTPTCYVSFENITPETQKKSCGHAGIQILTEIYFHLC